MSREHCVSRSQVHHTRRTEVVISLRYMDSNVHRLPCLSEHAMHGRSWQITFSRPSRTATVHTALCCAMLHACPTVPYSGERKIGKVRLPGHVAVSARRESYHLHPCQHLLHIPVQALLQPGLRILYYVSDRVDVLRQLIIMETHDSSKRRPRSPHTSELL